MGNKNNTLLQLLHGSGLGRATLWKLIQDFGSPEEVLSRGWNPTKELLFDKWKIGPQWEEDLEEVEKRGVKLISYSDENYPKNLLKIPDFPLLLYVKGSLDRIDPAIALIGTRTATLYGKQLAEKTGEELAASGVTVVSGLARGIDTAAHVGALQGKGKTVAVIGSGLSQLYPQENRVLAEKIASNGAVISEYPMNLAPAQGLFPRRNRIISGLSEATCLIESPLKGGGMLTMELGERQGRPLFAFPGRIDWPTFEGNHQLIQQGKARLATKGEDLLKCLNIINNQIVKPKTSLLTPEERAFLDQLPNEEKSIEQLVLLTQLPVMQLNVFLTRLILKKTVKEFPGKIYKKIS